MKKLHALSVQLLMLFLTISATAQTVFEHTVTSANKSNHMTALNHEKLNGNPSAVILVTQNFGKYNLNEVGVWYSNNKWYIFNQNRKEMPEGTKFFIYAENRASATAFTVTSRSNNTSRHITTINNATTNNSKDALVFVTQNYGKYNQSPVGVWYDKNYWKIYNEDLKAMPMGTKFNVLVLNQGANKLGKISVNAFSHEVNNPTSHISTIVPKIDNKNALVFTTNNWKGTYNKNATGVWYNSNAWKVFNQNRTKLQQKFNINVFAFNKPKPKLPTARLYKKTVKLPMHTRAKEISYTLEDGLAIYEGDIILGEGHNFRIEEPEPHPTPRNFSEYGNISSEKFGISSSMYALVIRQSDGIIDRNWLWKNGVIPYVIGLRFTDAEKLIIRDAISDLNRDTNLNIVPQWNNTYKTIHFKKRNIQESQGNSRVGRNRLLRQRIRLRSGFTKRTVMHELLHAAGAWHEQSRRDRDRFIEVKYENIDSGFHSQFDIHDTDAEIITPYDINSIMHYHGWAFSIDGVLPTIINRSTGRPVSSSSVLSRLDKDGINTVYPIDFYNSESSRSPTYARTVKLEVLQVVSRDLDGPGDENEFYIKTEIGPGFTWRPGQSSNPTRKQVSGKQRTSGSNVEPHWIHSHLINPGETYAKIWLQLREDDGLASNENRDDTFDINPYPALNEVELKIDTFNGQIFLGNSDGVFNESDYIGDLGNTIELEGFVGEFKAYIVFKVTIE